MLNALRADIDDVVRSVGGGVPASILGEYCTVYRIASNSSGDVLLIPPYLKNFPAYFKRITDKKVIESAIFDLPVFKALCDSTLLAFGDLVVDNATADRYIFAQRRSLGPPLFVKVEHIAHITRPTYGEQVINEPVGASEYLGYSGRTEASDASLALTNGVYAFGSPATPIPVGLQPINRVMDSNTPQLGQQMPTARFMMYLPPWPGIALQRLDRFNLGDTSYQAMLAYESNLAMHGTVAIVEQTSSN